MSLEIIRLLIHILFWIWTGDDEVRREEVRGIRLLAWEVGEARRQGKEFLDRGRRLQAEGRFEEAARAFRAGLYIDPENEPLRGALQELQVLRGSPIL